MKRILTTFFQKWPEYLLEILVLIVGIYGAFALDNWNDGRLSKQKEQLYLKAINEEFKRNKVQFEQITKLHGLARNALQGILIEYKKDTPNNDSLKLYQQRAWFTFTFDPSQSSIKSLLGTSSLDVIQNEELRTLLVGWSDLVADYQQEELGAESYYFDQIRPYIEMNNRHFETLAPNELVFGEQLDQRLESMIRNRILDLTYILQNSNLEIPFPENELVEQAIERIIELSEQK